MRFSLAIGLVAGASAYVLPVAPGRFSTSLSVAAEPDEKKLAALEVLK